MVDRAGLYYGTLLKGCLGFTQGGLLSPTIFNMVIDAMIWHWFALISGEEAGPEGFRQAVQCLATFLYVYVGILSSPCPSRLKAALDVLTELLYCVGVRTNVTKTMGIVFRPF